jgi:hypothetical protein
MELTRHGSAVRSVFDLLGHDENDLTAAFAFVLANCPVLLAAFLRRVNPSDSDLRLDQARVAIEVRGHDGRTDLEVTLPGVMLVVEAKRGWLLPSAGQLATYAPRVRTWGEGALITLSQASPALARAQLPTRVGDVPVVHLPWRDVLTDITEAQAASRGRERLWLDHLRSYLKGVIKIRSVADSWTYCVALSEDRPGSGGVRTFRQFVTDELCYFHPYGTSGWPTEPPNFLAFRWNGAVRRIHRVVHSDVVPSLLDRWPDIPATDDTVRPHAVYRLGPRIPPLEPIPNGAQYRAARLWVLLDQLQTCPTLADALAQTRALNSR